MTKIAINGFGRIGRNSFKIAFSKDSLEVLAINDLANIEEMANLLKYDSSYGIYEKEISVDKENSELIIDGTRIKYFSEPDPEKLLWREMKVDTVLECTGIFNDKEKAKNILKREREK